MNVLCHPGGRELLALDNSTGLPLVFQNCFPSYLLKFSSREESEKEQNRIRKSLRGVVKSCVGLFLNPQRRTKTNQTETVWFVFDLITEETQEPHTAGASEKLGLIFNKHNTHPC